jgi:hypothetical protein
LAKSGAVVDEGVTAGSSAHHSAKASRFLFADNCSFVHDLLDQR